MVQPTISRMKEVAHEAHHVGSGVRGRQEVSEQSFDTPSARADLTKEVQDGPVSGGSELTGRLVFPDSPDYESARLLWARQFSKFPLIIVFCQNVQDVVNAVSWCREHDIAFRARSGGHALEGWSSLDGGVVIDVSDMNQIHIDERAEVATVQTGATQGAVVDALGRIGYTIPSGGEITPGIGGVTLGGGIGWAA